MKRLLIMSICLLCFINLKASPQAPDFLIIGKDTISIYFLPLNSLDSTKIKEFYRNFDSNNEYINISTNLWRGYQAFWQLENSKLYLVGLKGILNSDKILKATFPENYINGKVWANWFSSIIAIPKDKFLKWDGIFYRTYFKEEVYDFREGTLIQTSSVNNYIHTKNGISRLDRKVITDKIFKKISQLNWKKFSICECDDKYEITIDEYGKISEIEVVPLYDSKKENDEFILDHKNCIEVFKKQLKNLQFDIIKWNGKPYNEKIYIEIFYTVDNKLENWTN